MTWIYILKKYDFYEVPEILIISFDYVKIKKYFDTINPEKRQGIMIIRYKLDKLIDSNTKQVLNHIERERDGELRDLINEQKYRNKKL